MDNTEDYVIEMLHITKVFPGIKANDDITLQLRRGEIHALLGENGAGKSTLMSVLFGLYQPEEGIIKKDGKEIAFIYPEWLDEEFEFQTRWNVKDLMAYYAGIITPSALGRLSGINPKQVWSYMHGESKPRKAQLQKMESALQRLGRELMHISFC